MGRTANAIVDHHGKAIFVCADCGEPITADDLFDLGLRAPDDGESRDDYFAAELLDGLSHVACTRGTQAS